MTTPRRPQRYTDLVHQVDGQRRAPVIPGSWVVVAAGDLAGGGGISLAKVIDGPSYTHADGVAIQAVWKLHDGREEPELRLTAVDLAELIGSATDVLRWLRNGVHPDRVAPEMVRAHRAASLARRMLDAAIEATRDQHGADERFIVALPAEDRAALRALIAVSKAIADLELAWRDMMRSRLPNLVRSLYWAGALEISRSAGCVGPPDWQPNTRGEPHPLIARLSDRDRMSIGWAGTSGVWREIPPAPATINPLVEVMQAIGVDAQVATQAATAEIVREGQKRT